MEILFDNPLATMYGPYFLIFFGFIIFFAVIILAFVKTQFDKTDRYTIPAIPPNIDPYEIAYLRGGTNEVARSAIFSLLQQGFIEIDNTAAKPVIKKNRNQPSKSRLNQIELLTLGWLGASREPKEFFGSRGLVEQLENYGRTYQSQLEQQQMLTGDEDRLALVPAKWSVYLLILLFGGYKTTAAILHGNFNLILLIIFTIVGLLIARAVSKLPRVTKLGKAYLDRLQTAFDNLKYAAQGAYIPSNPSNQGRAVTRHPTFAGVDPLLLSVGVFGSGILAGTVFDNYNQTFLRAQSSSSTGGSSCSSGCGSSCSSGSGGDGGGSSCGGGCGGCGGGD